MSNEKETEMIAYRVNLHCDTCHEVMELTLNWPEYRVYECPHSHEKIHSQIFYPIIRYKEREEGPSNG